LRIAEFRIAKFNDAANSQSEIRNSFRHLWNRKFEIRNPKFAIL
jgi:hypothetical protein